MTSKDTPAQDPQMRWLTEFAQSLPVDVRRAFTLRKVHALSYPQIAARLNLTVEEVQDLLVQALLKLGESLDATERPS